jgi:GDSL-like Lipase/Acylhydrolase family
MGDDSDRTARSKDRGAWRNRLGKALLALFVFVAGLELVFRLAKPTPRFQPIRASSSNLLEDRDGIPVWQEPGTKERRNEACLEKNPNALDLAFFGSSIFFGSGLSPNETFTTLLQQKLDARFGAGAACVLNYAEPGFSAPNKWALARDVLPRLHDAIVIWEGWDNDPFPYVFLGSAAYALRNARVNAAGYPDAFRLPPALNDFLFRHSRAYEYSSLAFVPEQPGPEWNDLLRIRVLPFLDQLLGLVRQKGAELIVVPAPHLDRPFRDQIESDMHRATRQWAQKNGVDYDELAKLLADRDPATIRLDPCCHYNAAGHRLLAERMLDLLLPKISARLGKR